MHLLRFALVGMTLFVAGCDSGPSSAEVTGEVKKASGEMMGAANVVFFPSQGETATVKTDDKGQFKVRVVAGKAKIAVMDATESTADMSPSAINAKPKVRINAKYATPESSGLTCDVGSQKDKLVLVVD